MSRRARRCPAVARPEDTEAAACSALGHGRAAAVRGGDRQTPASRSASAVLKSPAKRAAARAACDSGPAEAAAPGEG